MIGQPQAKHPYKNITKPMPQKREKTAMKKKKILMRLKRNVFHLTMQTTIHEFNVHL